MARPAPRAWMHKGRIYHTDDPDIPDALRQRMNRVGKEAAAVSPPPSTEDTPTIEGISPEITRALFDHGIGNADDIRSASDEMLLAVTGIGTATLRKLREAVG